MNSLITNYEDVYSSNGLMSHTTVVLDLNIMRDGGKLPSFPVSPHLGSHGFCPVTYVSMGVLWRESRLVSFYCQLGFALFGLV